MILQNLRRRNGKYHTAGANVSLRLLLFSGKVDEIPKNQYTKWLNYDRIECGLQFRRRASGDYLTVDDAGHKKKLKSYFIDEKIPQIKREHIWLLAQQSHVLWDHWRADQRRLQNKRRYKKDSGSKDRRRKLS